MNVSLTELYRPLLEADKRQKITGFLKLPKLIADAFHELDDLRSFALANAFRFWITEHNTGVRRHGVEYLKKIVGDDPKERKTAWYTVRSFMSEIGNILLSRMKEDPNLLKKVQSAKSLQDVKELIKKKSTGEKLMDLPGGWSWMRLSEDECEEEGELMQHCATDYRGDLVSLRDPQGKPHVTMTWNVGQNIIWQVKGKQNQFPDRKYWPQIEKFVDHFKPITMDSELRYYSGGSNGNLLKMMTKHNPKPNDPDIKKTEEEIRLWGDIPGGNIVDSVGAYSDQREIIEEFLLDKMRFEELVPNDDRVGMYDPSMWERVEPIPADHHKVVVFHEYGLVPISPQAKALIKKLTEYTRGFKVSGKELYDHEYDRGKLIRFFLAHDIVFESY